MIETAQIHCSKLNTFKMSLRNTIAVNVAQNKVTKNQGNKTQFDNFRLNAGCCQQQM
jgi:hypothetical protein